MSYLNTAPLIWGFRTQPTEEVQLSVAKPAACAEMLRTGAADVGLAPVAEIARQGWGIVPGTCIACDGPVRSILLFSRKPWGQVRTLAADINSRTSVVLAEVILRERYWIEPEVEQHPPELGEMLERCDAALLIGDAALQVNPAEQPLAFLDLGEEWRQLTGMPMVFAAWAGRQEYARPELEALFVESLDRGLRDLDVIVEQEGPKHGVTPALAWDYLTHNIRFRLGERERAGLGEFLRRAENFGLIKTCPEKAAEVVAEP